MTCDFVVHQSHSFPGWRIPSDRRHCFHLSLNRKYAGQILGLTLTTTMELSHLTRGPLVKWWLTLEEAMRLMRQGLISMNCCTAAAVAAGWIGISANHHGWGESQGSGLDC